MSALDLGKGLRSELVQVALRWQERFGVAPAITSAVSEYDAAGLVGMPENAYSTDCSTRTAVQRGSDFTYRGVRYQVKANRPSGRPGSPVTLVSKAKNLEWDRLIWILYDREYVMQEAWEFTAEEYKSLFSEERRISPNHMRRGRRLFPVDGCDDRAAVEQQSNAQLPDPLTEGL